MLKGFRDFILRGSAIEFAVGVVIGAAFTGLVDALIKGFIDPLIAALFGKPNLDAFGNFTLNNAVFSIGLILTAILNVIFVGFALYFFIVVPMNKLNERVGGEKIDSESPEVALLREIRDALRAQEGTVEDDVNDA
ncbi:MAG: large conductance mechanosensitive channel protein MscL [Actinobacteria bacterium]|nr:large conductance mechanosensitive channel protein MscL [Actinomycetota bacterium]